MEAIVEYDYTAQEPDELTLHKGDIIKDIKIMSGGWWQGTLRDKRGMFPDNFVKVIEATGNAAVKTEPEESLQRKDEVTLRNGSSVRKWCKVLFSYEPCNDDELALVPMDVIEFLGEVEEGWWSGRLRGRVGVFPSNFVSEPTSEGDDKHTDRDSKSLCRVLYPYEATNEDELTLNEGDIITLLSRDAPDKGWWKGELRGKKGLFPDNFVELINPKSGDMQQPPPPYDELWQNNQNRHKEKPTTLAKHSLAGGKCSDRSHARKSADVRVPNAARPIVSVAAFANIDKIPVAHYSCSKRLSDKTSSAATADSEADSGVNEELDGVEREEATPLLHLTASRAKAPRRRLPSSHHARNQTGNPVLTGGPITSSVMEDAATNGTIDTVDQSKEESENAHSGIKRLAPWIEELKLNQMEKKKGAPTDKFDNPEPIIPKKEIICTPRPVVSTADLDAGLESPQENVELRWRDKEKNTTNPHKSDPSLLPCPVSPTTTPAYVPYRVYNQLLERVTTLEERHIVLQRTVAHLSEQIIPLLTNASSHQQ